MLCLIANDIVCDDTVQIFQAWRVYLILKGPLSETVPSTSIEEANKEVKAESDKSGKARTLYMVATPEQKAKVGK